MSTVGSELSSAIAAAVDAAGQAVVRVEGRRRGPSSGIAWSSDGVIVAAHHNVEWDEDVTVGRHDGTTARATVVGRDPTTDLAVLRAPLTGLATPDWASDGLKVGHLVLALTRPGRTVRASLGVVHALGDEWRTAAGGRVDRYLQTDVGVQPGFSGSLLADVSGRALGMNNAGLMRGASLALPVATLRRVVETLVTHGHVRRGFIGIGTIPVSLPGGLQKTAGQPAGLLITSVQDDSAAGRAGLLLGDAIVAVDGRAVSGPADLLPFLEADRIGQAVTVRIVRAGEVRDVALTIGAREARGERA
ncbi:MAG TPA: trypsin-like peptidase domain-containing protein [Vicinamibacteria bacterium]|jgi:S1-C subfamily serine protease